MKRFNPKDRDCYTDEEFRLPNLLWEGGFRYSLKNCLYESVFQQIIANCACFPPFVEYKVTNLEFCTGKKLYCALEWMSEMGSSFEPDLTFANNTVNESLKCLQRCDLQTETVLTTSSKFPNKETFIHRRDFCFVLQKIAKICKNSASKKVFESLASWPNICLEVIDMNDQTRVCDEKDHANFSIANTNKPLVEFLFDYAAKNIAILNIFIREPYYTSYCKSEQISPISFIGNAGGLVSLCLGMSFISCFEVFYHLCTYFLAKILQVISCTQKRK